MHKKFIGFLAGSVGLIILDQLVKLWSRTAAQGVEGRTFLVVIQNVFELKLVFNKGVAFGMFEGRGVFLTPIAILIAAFTVYYSWKHRDEPARNHFVMALLASGAVGNLIDRLLFHQVTDMFWFRLIDFPVFNVADVCITFAGIAFAIEAFGQIFKKKAVSDEHPTGATQQTPLE